MNFWNASFPPWGNSPGPLQRYPLFSIGRSLQRYFPSSPHTLGYLPSHPPTLHTATSWFLSCWRMSWDWFGTQRMPTSWCASWQEPLRMQNSQVYLLSSVRGTFDHLSPARHECVEMLQETWCLGVFYPSVISGCSWPMGYEVIRRGLTADRRQMGSWG